ncbi:hypothetical protein [Paenirhodobacter sp.]|uniref:hypothetical protein n=1 Tax=Paenirhodobacter sp. TaxID=1965326 RepID=UPI003B3DC826
MAELAVRDLDVSELFWWVRERSATLAAAFYGNGQMRADLGKLWRGGKSGRSCATDSVSGANPRRKHFKPGYLRPVEFDPPKASLTPLFKTDSSLPAGSARQEIVCGDNSYSEGNGSVHVVYRASRHVCALSMRTHALSAGEYPTVALAKTS